MPYCPGYIDARPQDQLRMATLQTAPHDFLFKTDYPPQSAMAPGPVSPAERPADYIAHAFETIDASVARKVLHDNAAELYGVS